MSMTGGAFSAPISPDLTKEVQSFVVAIPAGVGVAQVVNPSVPVQSVTTYNYSSNVVRGTVTFSAGVVSTGIAATRTFLVPPGASASIDFADHDGDNAIGSVDGIDSISFIAVTPGVATTEASTLVATATAVAGLLYVNFASS
jgi:hypothetical protein